MAFLTLSDRLSLAREIYLECSPPRQPSSHCLPSQSLPRGVSPRSFSLHAPDLQAILYLHEGRQSNGLLFPSRKRSRCVPRRPSPPAQFCRKCERSVSPVPEASEERAAAFVREALEECDDYEQHDLARSVREALAFV